MAPKTSGKDMTAMGHMKSTPDFNGNGAPQIALGFLKHTATVTGGVIRPIDVPPGVESTCSMVYPCLDFKDTSSCESELHPWSVPSVMECSFEDA